MQSWIVITNMLDPMLLRSFLAVVRNSNFTEAGAQLGLRQPTISGHIQRLEAACGRRLFLRDTHTVSLTPDGEAMVGFAGSVLETEERARQHFAGSRLRGHLRFGASEDLVLRGLPDILRTFTSANPEVDLELTVGLSGILHERLEAGGLDLILAKRRMGETHGELIWREPLVWFARPGTRLDETQPVPLILMTPPSITRAQAQEAMERHGCAWRVVCTSGSQSGVHAAVLAGLGIGPHARSLVPPGLVILPTGPGLPPLGEVEFVVVGRRRALSQPAAALSAVIQSNVDLLRERVVGRGGGV